MAASALTKQQFSLPLNSPMARLIHGFDWQATDLGPIAGWPDRLKNAVELMLASPVPMIILWGHGGIMIYNDGYAEIAGLRHPAILGVKVREGWPEIADFNDNVIRVCLAGETLSYRNQGLFLLRNNIREQAWFDIYYSPLRGADDTPQGVLAVITETTAKVLSEQQRDRAETALVASNHALKQANADLEQFAFSASHDLQEPLRMVSIYSQLLQRRLSGKIDPEAEVLLKHCMDGAGRLENLIQDLLEYTRASAGSIDDTPPISLETIVRHVLNLLAQSIKDVNATVTTSPLPALRIQAIHAQQIFQNLISNAIKYRSQRQLEIRIGAIQDGDKWKFHVADNGIGIPDIYREQIFGLFKRLHSASEYSGTGLGLAICKKLADRYGGRIWVESEVGTGSTFYFTLPLGE